MKRVILGLLAATAMTASAFAQDGGPGLLYDLGGKFDKSFNEAAFNGAEKFKAETGTAYTEFEIQNPDQREQALRRFSEEGRNPVVAVGFAWSDALAAVAPDFPDVNYVIIDSVVEQPNVHSILFSANEGSYLVGILAAMATESKTVGFVGGMDIPLIRAFACGYKGGAVSAGATQVLEGYTGTTPAAWGDTTRATEIARSHFGQGANVVFAAAGGAGLGALQAAADEGKLGIGVDSNQNGIHPGKVLTSMLKRVDVAVYDSFKSADAAKGISVLGLKEGGVDYALDDNNKALITEEMKAAVEDAKAKIIAGDVKVHNVETDGACPY